MREKRIRKIYWAWYDMNRTPHPVIRLAGHYLARYGFKIGDRIAVDYQNGKITITKVGKPPAIENPP